MGYNIFTAQNLFQHNHKAYKPNTTAVDGQVVPAGGPVQPQQVASNVPGMNVVNGLMPKIQQRLATTQSQPTVQYASDWRGQNPNDPAGGFFDYAGRTFTTPEQEQKYAKQSKTRMGIVALADALRHLGNIYHTTKYSPSQQFNSPVQQEYALYKQGKAERDKDNYAIQQQRLAQAKWEADQAYKAATLGWKAKDYDLKEKQFGYNKEKDERNFNYNKEKDERNFNYNKEKNDRDFAEKQRMNDNTIRHQGVMEAQGQQRLAISYANLAETKAQHAWTRANGGAGGAGGKQKVFFSGKFGDVSRTQNLTLDESVAMVKQMRDMNWVTEKKYNEYMNALNNNDAASLYTLLNGGSSAGGKGATGGIIQAALTYHPEAANWLKDHHGFTVRGIRTPKKPAAAPQKPAATQSQPTKQDTVRATKPTAQKSNTVTAKSTVKGGSNGDNKKKGVYSGFSIHDKK